MEFVSYFTADIQKVWGFNWDRVGRDRTIIKEWQAPLNTLGYSYRIVLVLNHEMLGYSFEKASPTFLKPTYGDERSHFSYGRLG